MKLGYTLEEIQDAMAIKEQLYEKATEITQKYFEIVEGQKPKSRPNVISVEFEGDFFRAENDLDYEYDYVGPDFLNSFTFPNSWLFTDKLEEEMQQTKLRFEQAKEKTKIAQKEKQQQETREEELALLETLRQKYPSA